MILTLYGSNFRLLRNNFLNMLIGFLIPPMWGKNEIIFHLPPLIKKFLLCTFFGVLWAKQQF